MSRFAVAALAVWLGLALLGVSEARACSYSRSVTFIPARATGPQPRNAAVMAVALTSGPPAFSARDGATPVALEFTLLKMHRDPYGMYLLREVVSPASGSKRVYRGVPDPNAMTSPIELAIEFGDEVDVTPPALEGPIGVWVGRGQTVGACPGPPEYAAGLVLPAASERAYVSVYETDRQGGNPQHQLDVLVQPGEPAREVRLGVSGEPGREICFAFKTTDFAGNATSVGAPCCADENGVTGTCQRLARPPGLYDGPEAPDAGPGTPDAAPDAGPDAGSAPRGGGGCSVDPRGSPGGAAAITVVLLALVARLRLNRSPRPRLPGSGRCAGRGCGS